MSFASGVAVTGPQMSGLGLVLGLPIALCSHILNSWLNNEEETVEAVQSVVNFAQNLTLQEIQPFEEIVKEKFKTAFTDADSLSIEIKGKLVTVVHEIFAEFSQNMHFILFFGAFLAFQYHILMARRIRRSASRVDHLTRIVAEQNKAIDSLEKNAYIHKKDFGVSLSKVSYTITKVDKSVAVLKEKVMKNVNDRLRAISYNFKDLTNKVDQYQQESIDNSIDKDIQTSKKKVCNLEDIIESFMATMEKQSAENNENILNIESKLNQYVADKELVQIGNIKNVDSISSSNKIVLDEINQKYAKFDNKIKSVECKLSQIEEDMGYNNENIKGVKIVTDKFDVGLDDVKTQVDYMNRVILEYSETVKGLKHELNEMNNQVYKWDEKLDNHKNSIGNTVEERFNWLIKSTQEDIKRLETDASQFNNTDATEFVSEYSKGVKDDVQSQLDDMYKELDMSKSNTKKLSLCVDGSNDSIAKIRETMEGFKQYVKYHVESPLVGVEEKLHVCQNKTAELCTYVSDSIQDVKDDVQSQLVGVHEKLDTCKDETTKLSLSVDNNKGLMAKANNSMDDFVKKMEIWKIKRMSHIEAMENLIQHSPIRKNDAAMNAKDWDLPNKDKENVNNQSIISANGSGILDTSLSQDEQNIVDEAKHLLGQYSATKKDAPPAFVHKKTTENTNNYDTISLRGNTFSIPCTDIDSNNPNDSTFGSTAYHENDDSISISEGVDTMYSSSSTSLNKVSKKLNFSRFLKSRKKSTL